MKFDKKLATEILKRENDFIKHVLEITPFPKNLLEKETDDDDVLLNSNKNETEKGQRPTLTSAKKPRAKSLVELKQRLQQVTKKTGEKKLSYKEKLQKKAIKNQIRRKDKLIRRKEMQRNKPSKGKVEVGVKEENDKSEEKKVENKAIVFSKIDFPNDIATVKKPKKDPKRALQELKKRKEKLDKLREGGNIQKAVEIKTKTVYKNALAKASGEKVQDDPELLEKTIKKRKQQVKHSEKKWKGRIEHVEKLKDDRQKKRQENIDKRKKTKKTNKIKKAVKRGRIIPGY